MSFPGTPHTHSPGCRHMLQWGTFFTPSNTPAFSSFHCINLKRSKTVYKCTKTTRHTLFMWGNDNILPIHNQTGKNIICVSYLCRSVCPFSIWISLRVCSLPTPRTPLWKNDIGQWNKFFILMILRNVIWRCPPYFRNIIAAKEDGQTH